jgi:hypothetical protein
MAKRRRRRTNLGSSPEEHERAFGLAVVTAPLPNAYHCCELADQGEVGRIQWRRDGGSSEYSISYILRKYTLRCELQR